MPKGSETHFKVVVVSEAFDGEPLIDRHRKVNAALADELALGVHALSIGAPRSTLRSADAPLVQVAKTPQQWAASSQVPESPKCLGGSKHG